MTTPPTPASASTNSPWFSISMGLLGIIVGYGIGSTGLLGGGVTAQLAPNVPAAPSVPAAPAAPAAQPVPKVTSDDHIRGSKNAKVTLIEYSDFQCPFCKRHYPTVQQLEKDYGNDLNFVYRHFPLTSIHPMAEPAAFAAECVFAQKGQAGFWAMHDAIFGLEQITGDELLRIAKLQGVNEAKYTACLADPATAQKVRDQQSGGLSAGVQGTPANFIVDNATGKSVTIDGAAPVEQFKSAIDAIVKA